MQIETTRFGQLEANELISFPEGLLGFPNQSRFVLIEDGVFHWLQSADDPGLAFVVTDPANFFDDYFLAEAEIGDQILVVCNKAGDSLTANLLGPIVINPRTRVAKQVVRTDKNWTTRELLS